MSGEVLDKGTPWERTEYRDAERNLDREDGPAVVYADGHRTWFRDGARHREDGPAIIFAGGEREWFLDGNDVTEQVLAAPEDPRITRLREIERGGE